MWVMWTLAVSCTLDRSDLLLFGAINVSVESLCTFATFHSRPPIFSFSKSPFLYTTPAVTGSLEFAVLLSSDASPPVTLAAAVLSVWPSCTDCVELTTSTASGVLDCAALPEGVPPSGKAAGAVGLRWALLLFGPTS